MEATRKPTARAPFLKRIRQQADKQLEQRAIEAWEWAQQIKEPTRLVTRQGLTTRVLGVDDDVRNPRNLIEGQQVIELLLDRRRPRGSKGDHTRHWAIWRMITQLLEWSEFNEAGDGVMFPYPNPRAAAAGVVEGFRRAGLDSSLTIDRVLKHYTRHFETR